MIKVINLNKNFKHNRRRKVIFSDFDFSISKGESVGLFGPNGSGKTTLLNILSGIDLNFNGQINISTKRIAYVHQDPEATLAPWFNCEKNILLAREFHGLDINKGKELLKKLVTEFRINFSLEQYPFSLSGGQRQIITLMRALIIEPDVILLDEPFSALDVEKRVDVLRILIKHFGEGKTIIICSHRGEEIKSLITRAVIFGGCPTNIENNISVKDFDSREQFEDAVSKITFKKYGSEV